MSVELINYVKAPVEVTATKFVGGLSGEDIYNGEEIVQWIKSNGIEAAYYTAAAPWTSDDRSRGHDGWPERIEIKDPSNFGAIMVVNVGDYIVRGIYGEFYPQKPDVFENVHQLPGTVVQEAVAPILEIPAASTMYYPDGAIMSEADIREREGFFTNPPKVIDPILDELNAGLRKEMEE